MGMDPDSYGFMSTTDSRNDEALSVGRQPDTTFHRSSKYSNPESSIPTRGSGLPSRIDSRSIQSWPNESSGTLQSIVMDQSQQSTTTKSKHIVPPEELREWMSSKHTGPPIGMDGSDRLQNSDVVSISRNLNSLPTLETSASQLSCGSDDQTGAGLKPAPRRGLGLAARKQAALRKKGASTSSAPPVSTAIQKLEHAKKAHAELAINQAKRSRPPSLHRSASFLTLDEEEDQTSPVMLTKEPMGPMRGWESDTASEEEESFFDFGRGVNSLDMSDGLSD